MRRLSKYFNEPQLESLKKLGEAVRDMHYANIVVRNNGRDLHFEADWLRQVVPELLQMIHDEPPCQHQWDVGTNARRCQECGAFELLSHN